MLACIAKGMRAALMHHLWDMCIYLCLYIYIYIYIYLHIHIHAGMDKHDDTRCHEGSPHGGVPWQGTLCHSGALSCALPTYMQLRPSTGCRNITRTAPASALRQKSCFSRAKAFATKHTMTPTRRPDCGILRSLLSTACLCSNTCPAH
jgi:hypothetical protein